MDNINPDYYKIKVKGVECDIIDVVNALGLNFNLGNVLKYIHRDKENKVEDLCKAREYITREIEKLTIEIKNNTNGIR